MAIEDNINGKVGVCMNDSSKTTKKINYSSQYTESWIPVRDITNGMIILDNKFKVIVFSKLSKFNRYYDLLEIIDDVLEEFKNFTPKELVDKSHKDGGAWDLSKKLNSDTISWNLIKVSDD